MNTNNIDLLRDAVLIQKSTAFHTALAQQSLVAVLSRSGFGPSLALADGDLSEDETQ